MKSIYLKPGAWARLKDKLIADHGRKIMISWACKRELGFTVREHRDWRAGRPHELYALDFYEEGLGSWFLLRYGEYVEIESHGG